VLILYASHRFSCKICKPVVIIAGGLFPALKGLDWALVIGVAAALIAAMAWAARLM
jgi:hypothetical protein